MASATKVKAQTGGKPSEGGQTPHLQLDQLVASSIGHTHQHSQRRVGGCCVNELREKDFMERSKSFLFCSLKCTAIRHDGWDVSAHPGRPQTAACKNFRLNLEIVRGSYVNLVELGESVSRQPSSCPANLHNRIRMKKSTDALNTLVECAMTRNGGSQPERESPDNSLMNPPGNGRR